MKVADGTSWIALEARERAANIVAGFAAQLSGPSRAILERYAEQIRKRDPPPEGARAHPRPAPR